MLELAIFFGGIFALAWSLVVASVGLALLFALLVPVLIFCLLFRIGFALMKVAAFFVLLCFVAVWLI